MSKEPFIERLENEKRELDVKLGQLVSFKYTRRYSDLSFAEQERLNTQGHLMCAYSAILGARIEAAQESSHE